MEISLHPAKCTMWCAVSSQGLIGPIFVEGTITNQWYLQQLQNEVILVIQGAGHVDTTFFQQDGACPHIANVILDILHDVVMSCRIDSQSTLGVGGRGDLFMGQLFPLGLPQRSCVLLQPTHCSGVASGSLKLLLERSQVTCCVTQLTTLWFVYSKSMRLKDLILNMCSREGHMHANSP
jgi:hypothetical protein